MKKEITALKKKLPKYGYTSIVVNASRDKDGNTIITNNMVKQFFNGRAVKHENKIAITKAVNKAISDLQKRDSQLKKIITHA